jgi:hypothetical protein
VIVSSFDASKWRMAKAQVAVIFGERFFKAMDA